MLLLIRELLELSQVCLIAFDQKETLDVIALLEEKRDAVLANHRAGYFRREWRKLNDHVEHMIGEDSRYQAIQSDRDSRHGEISKFAGSANAT